MAPSSSTLVIAAGLAIFGRVNEKGKKPSLADGGMIGIALIKGLAGIIMIGGDHLVDISRNNDRNDLAITVSESTWDLEWSDRARFGAIRDTEFTAPAVVAGEWSECTLTILDGDQILVLCGDAIVEPPRR